MTTSWPGRYAKQGVIARGRTHPPIDMVHVPRRGCSQESLSMRRRVSSPTCSEGALTWRKEVVEHLVELWRALPRRLQQLAQFKTLVRKLQATEKLLGHISQTMSNAKDREAKRNGRLQKAAVSHMVNVEIWINIDWRAPLGADMWRSGI